MKLRLLSAVLSLPLALAAHLAQAQQPASLPEALQSLSSKPATTHTVSAFDPAMLQSANARFHKSHSVVNGITVENFSYPERSFFVPVRMDALRATYEAAGYQYIYAGPVDWRALAMPRSTFMVLWLHKDGTNIDRVVMMLSAPQLMRLVELTGTLKPADLVRLSGHFGIPQIDPRSVIVPAPIAPAVPAQPQMRGQLDIDPGGGGWGGGSGGPPHPIAY
jgi:hypothetical protein